MGLLRLLMPGPAKRTAGFVRVGAGGCCSAVRGAGKVPAPTALWAPALRCHVLRLHDTATARLIKNGKYDGRHACLDPARTIALGMFGTIMMTMLCSVRASTH